MRKIYYFVFALLCVLFLAPDTHAQQKLWFIAESDQSINHMSTDGSDFIRATDFREHPEGSTTPSGYNPVFAMQLSSGEIIVYNADGGAAGYGDIAKIDPDGVHRIIDPFYVEGRKMYMTEGHDGFIYGVHKIGGGNHVVFKVDPDGINYDGNVILTYGFKASELTTASTGEIFGTTLFHLYRMRPNANGIDILYTFSKPTGKEPVGKLVEGTDGYLYGVTKTGGTLNYGAVYKIRKDGTDYRMLHEFNNDNGKFPDRGLTMHPDGYMYGVTLQGGVYRKGVLYRIMPDGSNFEVLYSFDTSFSHLDFYESPSMSVDNEGTLYGITPGEDDRQLFRYNSAGYFVYHERGLRLTGPYIFNAVQPTIRVLLPKDNATEVPSIFNVAVNSVQGALTYGFQVSTDPNFVQDAVYAHREDTIAGFVSQSYNTTFYARGRSSLWPYWSEPIRFTTHAAEKYAFISKPKDGSVNNPAPTLKVTANSISGAKRYTIELSTTPDFSANVLMKNSAIDFQRTMTFENLEYSTLYYARMKTDISGYGRVTSFSTMPEPESTMAVMNAEVHPNPSKDFFNVRFDTPNPHPVKLQITTLQGESVGSLETDGTEPVQFGEDLQKGIYILRVIDGGQVIMKRLVKE